MTAEWARHPVSVLLPRRGVGKINAECENGEHFFDSFDEAVTWAQRHAASGEEDRWCEHCYRHQPTCDDYCLECGADT